MPAAFCVDIYRECYRYEGEVLVTGYPRDDALVRPDPEIRDQVLQRLGVAAETTGRALRPDLARVRRHRRSQGQDVRRARARSPGRRARRRSHHPAARSQLQPRDPNGAGQSDRAGILDVTRYPEINDLILAADVAVLDYSSLRFDWLLTGKPLLFFVPDLEDYLAQRTALFDFGPTAPGPLLRTTDEVIDGVCSDLDGSRPRTPRSGPRPTRGSMA